MRILSAASIILAVVLAGEASDGCSGFSMAPLSTTSSYVDRAGGPRPRTATAPPYSTSTVASSGGGGGGGGSKLSMMSAPGASYVLPKLALKGAAVVASAVLASTGVVKLVLDRPSRTYGEGSVAQEYDEWTSEGILEYYWGEHIHLGYYGEDVKYRYRPLQEAQYAFIDEMMKFGGIDPAVDGEANVLDVGCGFGGTSRYLARALGPNSTVTAITLSPKQVERAQQLAVEQNTPNAQFQVQDALDMGFPNNTFDIVWACESGEHMPDKKRYIDEMMRVLKPGGKFVMATWCQRDDREVPFDKRDLRDLQYLYEEW
jgi:MPBQ/MSBQ methyltransferase